MASSLRTISPQSLPPLTKPQKPTKTQKFPSQLKLIPTFRRSAVVCAAEQADILAVKTSDFTEVVGGFDGQLSLEGVSGGGGNGGQDLDKLIDRAINATIVLAAGTFAITKLVTIDHGYWHLFDVVRKEIWYRPDMFFYRDMLMRNKKVEEAKRVWGDLKREEVLFDQHTFGDIMRLFWTMDCRMKQWKYMMK